MEADIARASARGSTIWTARRADDGDRTGDQGSAVRGVGAWLNAETLLCGGGGRLFRRPRHRLRAGGEWVVDMIGPTARSIEPPCLSEVRPEERIGYTLHWGENGRKHADAG